MKISIPSGAIKRCNATYFGFPDSSFQFLLVRLKADGVPQFYINKTKFQFLLVRLKVF